MGIEPNISEEIKAYLTASFSPHIVNCIVDAFRAGGDKPDKVMIVRALEDVMTGQPTLASAAQWLFDRVTGDQEEE